MIHKQYLKKPDWPFVVYRTRDRLKYLAGTEIGSGMLASDSSPEEKAAELRSVQVSTD